MLRKILFSCVLTVSIASELSVVAITHPGCHICRAWHNEVAPYYELEAGKTGLPKLKEYDFSDREGRLWVQTHVGSIAGLPTFVVLSDGEVKQKFTGYLDYQDFFVTLRKRVIQVVEEEQLAQSLRDAQDAANVQ